MSRIFLRIHTILSSPKFFWAVIALFVLQALWFVFSALYPMAFDEAYHFNLVRVYALQWLPFLAEHPGGNNFNAVTRYPSYFFNYLLSFPYRIIATFTDSLVWQVVSLRLINVGIFAYSLVLYRKLFIRLGVSHALTNVGLLLFTLIPIVPMLAAHINYDNALMLLIAWLLLVGLSATTEIKAGNIPVKHILIIGIVCAITSVVKYAALPILLGVAIFVALYTVWAFRHVPKALILDGVKTGWRKISPTLRIILPLALILGGVLFFERYGINLIRYGSLVPDCDQVLSVEQCMEFGPYERNFKYRQQMDPAFEPDIVAHAKRWTTGMWYRLFFMINGDVPVDRYHNFPPLPIPALTATAIFIAGLAALLSRARRTFSDQHHLLLLAVPTILYVGVLWHQNYQGYSQLGRTAALNGRYLLLVILPVIALFGLALSQVIGNRLRLKIVVALLAIVLFLQGGGLLSFIVRSSDTWYWPNETVQSINQSAQNVTKPLIFGSDDMYLRTIPR